MNRLALNLAVAIAWCALTGSFTLSNLGVGFLLGLLAIAISHTGGSAYAARILNVARFLVVFLRELVVANLTLALQILNPRIRFRPAIIAIDLAARTDGEITAVANTISLTPGSLSIDISADRRRLYVHVLDVDDADRIRQRIKQVLEGPLLAAIRQRPEETGQ
ncbi:MAG: Na+/H+ antiporter subunit E [Planctomycetota bacterium]